MRECLLASKASRRYLRLTLRRLTLTAGLLSAATAVLADHGNEVALKAAFLYNFALYTEWPALPPVFEYCIADKPNDKHDRHDGSEAIDALAKKEIAGRPIRIRHLGASDALATCNVLYVTAAEKARFAKLIGALENRPVLTVVDGDIEGEGDAMLQFHLADGRVGFSANLSRARSSGLAFSAKMLRLARSVR